MKKEDIKELTTDELRLRLVINDDLAQRIRRRRRRTRIRLCLHRAIRADRDDAGEPPVWQRARIGQRSGTRALVAGQKDCQSKRCGEPVSHAAILRALHFDDSTNWFPSLSLKPVAEIIQF